MGQSNFPTRLGTPPAINEFVKRLILCESSLAEIKHTLNEANRKVDSILAQPNGSHASGFNNAPAPENIMTRDVPRPSVDLIPNQFLSNANAPNQILTHNGWELNSEFGPFRSLV